jgi:hypothetical protein
MLALAAAILVGAAAMYLALEARDTHRSAASPAPMPATASTVQSLRSEIRARQEAETEEAERGARLAECEYVVSVSRAQVRDERECREEVEANFAAGNRGAPTLRAGRFR